MAGYASSLLFNCILEILIIAGQETEIKVYGFFPPKEAKLLLSADELLVYPEN